MQDETQNRSLKRTIIVIATLSSFLTPFTLSSINIALPSIENELKLSALELSWVASAYLLASAVFLVPIGRLADIKGRKKIFAIGIAMDVAATIICGFSTSGLMLIAFRAIQGLGSALIFGTGVAMLTSILPGKERGKALGINVAAVYAGLSVGPVLGGLITAYLGWRSIFWVNALIGVVILIAVIWKLKGEWADARGEQFDLKGSIIYSLSLVAIMFGFSELPGLTGIWLILGGLVLLVVFLALELKTAFPVFNVALFRHNNVFAFSNLAALINYSATFSVSFLLSLYLQIIKGFPPEQAGLVLIAQPVIQVIMSPIAGALSDKMEPRLIASGGMTLTAIGLLLLVFVGSGTDLWYILTGLLVLGLGFGLFSSPNTNAVMGSVQRKEYGVASGTLGTMRTLGQALSIGIAMILFAVLIGHSRITPEVYDQFLKSMKIALIISASLCFGGIFASAIRGKTHSGQDNQDSA